MLPLLGRVPGAACRRPALTRRLRQWLEALPEPATIVFDYERDWLLLADACLGREHPKPSANVGETLHLDRFAITHPLFEQAKNHTYTQAWPPHHALADARALRAGYFAWLLCLSSVYGEDLGDRAVILFLDFDGVTHPEPYAPAGAFTQLPLIESVVRQRVYNKARNLPCITSKPQYRQQ